MLGELKGAALLDGVRGEAAIDKRGAGRCDARRSAAPADC